MSVIRINAIAKMFPQDEAHRMLFRVLGQLQEQIGVDVAEVNGVTEAQTAATAAQTSADTAQASATAAATAAANASESSTQFTASPGTTRYVRSSPTGTFPADGNYDITSTFKDKTDSSTIATLQLRGAFTQSSATFAVTQVSSTGTISFSLSGDGTSQVVATITATLADGSKEVRQVSWVTDDISVEGERYFF